MGFDLLPVGAALRPDRQAIWLSKVRSLFSIVMMRHLSCACPARGVCEAGFLRHF